MSLEYFPERQLLARHWKKASNVLNDMLFREEMLEVKKHVIQYKPLYLLGDTRNFLFVIDIDMQTWIDVEIYAQFGDLGVKKMAFINSTDRFARMSVEQSIDESPKNYEIRYFDTEYEALEWLIWQPKTA